MVRVADRFCIDRHEASVVDDVEEAWVSPHYPPSPQLLPEVLAAWKQRSERGATGVGTPPPELPSWELRRAWGPRAQSRAGVLPQGQVSQGVAARACASAGKRLCTGEEWRTACRGQADTAFPYGPSYRAGACNVDRNEHPAVLLGIGFDDGMLDPRMNLVSGADGPLLRLTGATGTCASRWGDDAVFDLVGNLDEWTVAPDALLGGFYARDTRQGCASANTRHRPAFFNYSTGFRCCDRLR
jgi:sulfatase modifying factor 1